jgi:hypothetical protein
MVNNYRTCYRVSMLKRKYLNDINLINIRAKLHFSNSSITSHLYEYSFQAKDKDVLKEQFIANTVNMLLVTLHTTFHK